MEEIQGSIKKEIHIFWTIDKFFDLVKNFNRQFGDCFRSPNFLLNSKQCYILFGSVTGNCHFLVDVDDKNGFLTDEIINIKVNKLNGSFYIDEEAEKKHTRCWTRTSITKKNLLALKECLSKDNSLTVHLTHTSLNSRQQDSFQTISLEGCENLSQDFEALLRNGYYSDVTVNVKEKEFNLHNCVLAVRAPEFHKKFFAKDMINMNDCDAVTFKDFSSFLYSGKTDGTPSSRLFKLYKFADKYKLCELKEMCVKRLIIEMSIDIVCDALRMTALYDEKELLDAATNFFIGNAENVLKTENWETFMKTYPKIANALFQKCLTIRTK